MLDLVGVHAQFGNCVHFVMRFYMESNMIKLARMVFGI